MGKKSNGVKESSQQRAFAEVGKAQLEDFRQRWLPVQQKFAADIVKNGEQGSFQRRRAEGALGTDTAARFGNAAEKLDATAAAGNSLGSSAHKLGIAGMGDDQATSKGLGVVAANQGGDDALVSGLGAVTALGRGEKAAAVGGMQQAAAIGGQQAAADAERSLQDRMGNASLAGAVLGTGAGLWQGQTPLPTAQNDPRAGIRGQLGY